MSLSFPPQLTGDNKRDIVALQSYLYDLVVEFDNAAGQAVDPTQGQGGDGSLTVDSAPTDVVLTSSTSLSTDQTLFGQLSVSFALPSRAVAALIYYKESGDTLYHVSTAITSPYSIANLKVGVSYNVRVAGQAANGSIGPLSTLQTVLIDNSGAMMKAPADAQYLVAALSPMLSAERLVISTPTVAWSYATAAQASASVPDNSLTTAKTLDVKSGTYTPTLTNTTNIAASTAFVCQWLRVGSVVTVSGVVNVDPVGAGAVLIGISLPIASAFVGLGEQCGGVAFCNAVAGQGAAIYADIVNSRAAMAWVAVDVTSQSMWFTFSYLIV